MKLEVGKFYRTRSGERSYVEKCRPSALMSGNFIYIGWVNRELRAREWLDDGTLVVAPHAIDLVAEV